jgi:transposase
MVRYADAMTTETLWWIVERTLGWFNCYQRLSKDYELLPQTSEAVIHVVMIHLMIRRLAHMVAY